MKQTHLLSLITASTLSIALTSCTPPTNAPTSTAADSAHPYGQPLTAKTATNTVRIYEGSRLVSTLNSARPNVETTRFIEEQNKIVVKSRGNHGPATLQLFDTHSGKQLSSIPAYQKPTPAWAAGMGE
ncbi:hypothetical protein [Rubritalea tangerina]|uniref:Uncharacterized protein n=1 Tax=Rubritalea tangerina TaxID=430798 RepID=A0ABW4Z7B9_9BACT